MGASPLQDPSPGRAALLPAETPPLLSGPAPLGDTDGLGARELRLGRARDWLIGAALLVGLVAAVQYSVGWGTLLAPWLAFSPLLVAWLFLLTALSYGLRAVRVHDWFCPRLQGQFIGVLRLTILHNSANNLLPMRTGELVFPWLMRRYFGFGLLEATAALLWIRILDMHFLGLVAILILDLRDPWWVWWAVGLVWVAGLSVLALIGRVGASPWLTGGGRPRALVRQVAAAAPRDPWLIARVYLWTAGTWTLKFIAFASVLAHFVPAAFWRVLAGVMGAELSSVLPVHGIAGSGSYEIAAMAALVPLGVAPKVALAGAVNLHLFVLGTTLLLGGLAFLLPRPPRP